MSTQTHSVTFAEETKSNNDFVLLEQEPWDPYIGFLTKMGVIGFLNELLFKEPEVQANCASDGSFYTNTLYAYPSRPNLSFKVGWVNAIVPNHLIKFPLYTEVIQCDMNLKATLKYPAMEIKSVGWVNEVYGETGEVTTKPNITIVSDGVKFSKKVYGSVLVTYKVCQHVFPFSVKRRTEAIENFFSAFAYAIWTGGNTFLELKAPEGAEEGECNTYRGTGTFSGKEPNVPENVPSEDEYEDIDYCTQLINT